jgi:starvation-inducible DNA-binding protein
LESIEDGLRKTPNKERKTMKTGSATQLKKSGSGPFEPLGALTHDGITEIRDYHLLLDEQAAQIFAMTDDIAERARKIGGDTLRSIGDIAKNQRLKDSDDSSLSPKDMLAELRTDNGELTRFLRLAHEICERNNDVATASMIEVWIDQTERRTWFLSEIVAAL